MTIYHKKCNIVKYIIFFLPVILYSFSWLSRLKDQIVRTNTEVDVGIWNDQNTFIFIINNEKDMELIFEHPVIKGSKFVYNIFSKVYRTPLQIAYLIFGILRGYNFISQKVSILSVKNIDEF